MERVYITIITKKNDLKANIYRFVIKYQFNFFRYKDLCVFSIFRRFIKITLDRLMCTLVSLAPAFIILKRYDMKASYTDILLLVEAFLFGK